MIPPGGARMSVITSIADLEALYEAAPSEAARLKVAPELTPAYRAWIGASRFCLLATVGPEGTDCSPRGDDGPVVEMPGDGRILMPDWRGNNRLDSLRNIVRDGRVSLAFLIPGATIMVRVNGRARVETAPALIARFSRKGIAPRSVIVIEPAEVYAQCARAILRSGLWEQDRAAAADLPRMGDFLAELSEGEIDAACFEDQWARRAPETLW